MNTCCKTGLRKHTLLKSWFVKSCAAKIKKVSKNLPQKNSETVTKEHDEEIPKEDIYLQKKDRK